MGGTVKWTNGGVLETSVRAGERGPLVVLSGAAEFTNITQLIEVIGSQLSGGTRQLVIDVSTLCFADSTSIWFLLLTARTMKMHGGTMVLIRPQPAVVRGLTLAEKERVMAGRAASPGTRPRRQTKPNLIVVKTEPPMLRAPTRAWPGWSQPAQAGDPARPAPPEKPGRAGRRGSRPSRSRGTRRR